MSTLRSHLRAELRRICIGAAIATAILLVAVWLVVLFMIGSPRMLLRLISGRVAIFPPWLFILLIFAFYAVCGFCIGAVLFFRRRSDETAKYRGAFFFSIAVAASYLWYALFFGARFFLPAALLSAVAVTGLVVAAVNFRRVSPLAAIGLFSATAWGVYCLVISVLCFFFL